MEEGNEKQMFVRIRNLQKSYGSGSSRTQVLKHVDLDIEKGKICTILGPSGSGKSTLLNAIGGMDTVDQGQILIEGMDISAMKYAQLTEYRRTYIGYIFQFYNLIPDLTVKENMETTKYLGTDTMDVEELLDILGLREHQFKFPSELSGGQQQRCAIGRALVKKPSLLLCDEPTGALDSKTSQDILELLERLNKEFGMTMILVTHNADIAGMSDQIVEIRDGEIVRNQENPNKLTAKEVGTHALYKIFQRTKKKSRNLSGYFYYFIHRLGDGLGRKCRR